MISDARSARPWGSRWPLEWPAASSLNLPFEQTKLANGLTLIVHEDHVLPQVATNIIYRVGFEGRASRANGIRPPFRASDVHGHETRSARRRSTSGWSPPEARTTPGRARDFTDYHEAGSLHRSCRCFSGSKADRLAELGREIDQPKLDLQRDVVRNERRQSIENRPYGKVELRMPELMYPEAHPYHHPVIGSHADLEAASVKDVRAFFEQNYVPANASLVVAGDVQAADVKDIRAAVLRVRPRRFRRGRAKPSKPLRSRSSTRWCARPSKTRSR